MSNSEWEQNVNYAETLTQEEIFKNALQSNTDLILKQMNENDTLIQPANSDALGTEFISPGLGNNTFETLDYLVNDASLDQLTPNANETTEEGAEEATEETLEEKETFVNNLSPSLLERKKQTKMLEELVEAFELVETFQNQEKENKLETGEVSNRDKTESVKTLVLDTGTGFKPLCENLTPNTFWNKVKYTLTEPMIFGGQTDVYLESLTINNPAQANNTDNLYFCLEFKFQKDSSIGYSTFSNKGKITFGGNVGTRTFDHMNNKFVLPNENTSGSGDNKIMKYRLKSNYVGICNVTKIKDITVTFTNENGDSIQVGKNITHVVNKALRFEEFNVVNNVAQGTTTAFEIDTKLLVDLGGGASIDPSIYYYQAFKKSDGTEVGRITAYSDEDITATPGDPTTLTMVAGTLVALTAGDTLIFSRTPTNITVRNNVSIGTTTAFEISHTTFGLLTKERIYNKNGVEVGIVTQISDTGAPNYFSTLTISAGTSIGLSAGDELFFAPGRAEFNFYGDKPIGSADEVERAIPDDGEYRGVRLQDFTGTYGKKADLEANGLLPGVTLYNKDGKPLGIIDSVEVRLSDPGPTEPKAGALFFRNGLQTSLLSGGEPIYKSPPRAVFADNSKTNRVIMELIFRERKENILTVQ
jgi:hypothetical protein